MNSQAMIIADDLIVDGEGFSATPYVCPTGFDTIGFGTRVPLTDFELDLISCAEQPTEITKLQGMALMRFRARRLWARFSHRVKSQGLDVETLPYPVQAVLIDCVYTLGSRGLQSFKKMIAALVAEDWKLTATELLNSKYASDVKGRADRNAELLRTWNRKFT